MATGRISIGALLGRVAHLPLLAVLLLQGCGGLDTGSPVLTAETPLHLEAHLDAAAVTGSAVPEDLPGAVEWRFDEPRPDWKRAYPFEFDVEPARLVQTDDALRLLFDGEPDSDGDLVGGLYVDLPGWQRQEWAYVAVQLRAEPGVAGVGLGLNLSEPERHGLIQAGGEWVNVMADGTTQTYLLPADTIRGGEIRGPWNQLALWFWGPEAERLDLLSVSVIPKEAAFSSSPSGVSMEARQEVLRRTLFVHAPARLEYEVEVPSGGRLDVALGVVRAGVPVRFEIDVAPTGGEPEALLEETWTDAEHWAQRSIDLTDLAGQTVTLGLEATSEIAGTVALWVTPTLSGARMTAKPNVVFYVIDGAGADSMSVYGYNRRTTPNIERIAAEGAVFEHAYSNSSWTRPSTASFLTSLQHSVLGGLRNGRNPVPAEVLTLAEHMHRAGYQTAALTSNPNAGRMSNLERGVDLLREVGVTPTSISSVMLHENFWRWRTDYPAEPYWVHFQTTDVHSDNQPTAPFAGLFAGPQGQGILEEWGRRLADAGGGRTPYSDAFAATGIDRQALFNLARDLHDETMAHQDYQLGRFVERLKASGEWENTLLIIGADHGHAAGTVHFGLGSLDELPPIWEGAMSSSFQTRVPLIFVWPGRIPGGQRFEDPVSMLDVLPTVLELAGLPLPGILQGQSLAPLLLGEPGWEPRPVILDEFVVDDDTGEWRGQLEVIDGRWGASLYIGPPRPEGWIHLRGHRDYPPLGSSFREGVPSETPRLLLYDIWRDPYTLHSVHEERPDLVEKYTAFLEAQWETHQELAKQFTRSEDSPLTPEQLRALRELGYIQ